MDELELRIIQANAFRLAAHSLPYGYENSMYFSQWLFDRANELEAGTEVQWTAPLYDEDK